MKSLFTKLCFALAALTTCTATNITAQEYRPDPSQAKWVVLPDSIAQKSGKYPPTHVVFYRLNCGRNSQGVLKNPLIPGTYHVANTGAAMAATNYSVGDCTVGFDLTTEAAEPGTVMVQMYGPDKNGKEVDLGFGLLYFSDPKANPIPGRPQVDVIWGLIGKDVCSDAFGSHVVKRLYCIAVKIGNNSGYPIQLAGVGFKTLASPNDPRREKAPNTSYQLARAVAQTGDVLSPRNIAFGLVSGGGLLMAGFTPYFKNDRNNSRWATGAAIVSGPLLAAFNLVSPDMTVRQGNNLDDQAFRDGKLIPNNTQITTVIFLKKASRQI